MSQRTPGLWTWRDVAATAALTLAAWALTLLVLALLTGFLDPADWL